MISRRAWWTAIVYIAAAAVLLRFYDLALKPLHHDEGVNTLLLTNLVRPPHSFTYDPSNFHGPTLFYFGWLSVALFGLTTVGIRFLTAVAGLLAVLLLLPLKHRIGTVGALAAASLVTVSPGAVYFSRYFIHESLLVCFTIAAVVAWTMWWRRGRAVYLYLSSASSALMFATKETAIISAVVLVGAGLGAVALCALREQGSRGRRPSLRHAWQAMVTWGAAPTRRRGLRLFVPAIGVFLVINAAFYTSFFTRWQGAIDAVITFTFWARTGRTEHTHAWYAYLQWLSAEELPLLVLGGAGAAWALWRSDDVFAVFASLWAAGVLVAYSAIPYKTPWLTLNVIAPLAITGGYAFELMWRRRHLMPRAVPAAIAVAVAGAAAYHAVVLSFVQYDNARFPYVYAHTSREVLALVREIGRIEEANPGASIAVTSQHHFPLSWYLRSYPAGYYGQAISTNDPVVVASEEHGALFDVILGERYQRIGLYTLRPGVRLVLYVRRDLRRPLGDASNLRPQLQLLPLQPVEEQHAQLLVVDDLDLSIGAQGRRARERLPPLPERSGRTSAMSWMSSLRRTDDETMPS